MLLNQIELLVLIKDQPILEYLTDEKLPRTFVEGRPGSIYELVVHNHSIHRVEVILSVDGLAITDGKPADAASLGFVLSPRATTRLPGWMLDTETAAAFIFSGKQNSYAVQTGEQARNVGVIGAMAFAEHIPSTVWREFSSPNYIFTGSNGSYVSPTNGKGGSITTAATGIFNSFDMEPMGRTDQSPKNAIASVQSLGTGFGEATPFRTTTVTFQRGVALGTLLIYYDDRRGLKARGIVLERQRPRQSTPDAFPGKRLACVPPPGWSG